MAVKEGIRDQAERERILKLLEEMAADQGKPTFAQSYQKFIAAAGDHMKLIGPFIPLLGKYSAVSANPLRQTSTPEPHGPADRHIVKATEAARSGGRNGSISAALSGERNSIR